MELIEANSRTAITSMVNRVFIAIFEPMHFSTMVLLFGCLLVTSMVMAGEKSDSKYDSAYSPYVGVDYPTNLYWGDTHLHTNLSLDSYLFQNTLTPEDAYRFAEGQAVTTSSGQKAKLSRPLDFLVISDHAEYLGILASMGQEDKPQMHSSIEKRWLGLPEDQRRKEMHAQFSQVIQEGQGENYSSTTKASLWKMVTATADRHNIPGQFTAFIGYEWTSTPQGNNLHRVVVFRDGAEKVNQVLPFSSLESLNPEDLWDYLGNYESKTGGHVLAIPHNANGSGGLMFSEKTFSGDKLTREYAKTRMRWEPIMEVTQIKGDGESHPFLSPTDEFADYESWDKSNLARTVKHEDWMYKHEYARSALKLGLHQEALLGVNPFKFGMIGSSDSHTGMSAVEENDFFGKWAVDEPSPNRAAETGMWSVKEYTAAGYAAVWAQENTRASLFDAMKRRETYATTGPRMVVRFFGGWDFKEQDDLRPDYDAIGYRKGVPMGGDLSGQERGKAPMFMVVASKDPEGANLERIQIVKGWLDGSGETHEQVYDVGLSDGREADPSGRMAPPIQSTVDVKTATYTNTVGDPQLSTVWRDPDFDAGERVFYYARVLEIPTPRWTTYDAVFYGNELPDGVPAAQQERAYTSPIWYTP